MSSVVLFFLYSRISISSLSLLVGHDGLRSKFDI